MLKSITISLIILLLSPYTIGQETSSQILKYLNTSSVNYIFPYLSDEIDIDVRSKDATYSKQRAIQIVNNFLTEEMIKSCSLRHQGKQGNSSFYLYEYASNEKRFEISFLFNDKKIIEIRIERDE